MRTILALMASGLSVLAAFVSIVSGEGDVAPFFAGLAVVSAVIAWLVGTGPRPTHARTLAKGLAVSWVGLAIWISVLLIWYQATCACSRPEPLGPPPNIAGIPTTAFHLAATYLGGALVIVSAFGRSLGQSVATRGDERR